MPFSVLLQEVNPLAELLHAPKTAGPERDAVFKSVTKEVTQTLAVAIAKLQVHPKDDDPLLKLGILQYIRGAFAIQCKQLPSVMLVKADDERLFMAGKNPVELVKAGLALLHLCADLTARFPDLKTTVSVGVSAGHILRLPNDYYGDAVNTASKLGEDNASPGELAVSRAALDVIRALDDGRELLQHLGVDEKVVLISKVNIQYAQLTLAETTTIVALYPGLVVPSSMLVHSHIKADKRAGLTGLTCLEALPLNWDLGSGVDQNLEDVRYNLTRDCTMMQTDMSGFTRLTRQYGIMHFLALIMHCRKIYDESIGEFGGRVIKYDGDNVITFFPTPEMGVLAASRILYRTNEYNRCARSNARPRSFILLQVSLIFSDYQAAVMTVGFCCRGAGRRGEGAVIVVSKVLWIEQPSEFDVNNVTLHVLLCVRPTEAWKRTFRSGSSLGCQLGKSSRWARTLRELHGTTAAFSVRTSQRSARSW